MNKQQQTCPCCGVAHKAPNSLCPKTTAQVLHCYDDCVHIKKAYAKALRKARDAYLKLRKRDFNVWICETAAAADESAKEALE